MSDSDILDAFPGVQLLPRDPLAPTSLEGACAWLAERPQSRVLAVGHREGTKAMARLRVPTPHCCIAIFTIEREAAAATASMSSYRLKDILSYKGRMLKPQRKNEAEKPQFDGDEDMTLASTGLLADSLEVVPPSHADAFLTGDKWLRRQVTEQRARTVAAGTHPTRPIAKGQAIGEVRRAYKGPSSLSRALRKTIGIAKGKGPMASSAPVEKTLGQLPRAVPDRRARAPRLQDGNGTAVAHSEVAFKSKSNACAGHGFRVAALARESSGSKGPRIRGLLGTTPEALSGPGGVLAFLNPADLCMVSLTRVLLE